MWLVHTPCLGDRQGVAGMVRVGSENADLGNWKLDVRGQWTGLGSPEWLDREGEAGFSRRS